MIERIKFTGWLLVRDEPIEVLAKRLGVQPDVLKQAQREYDEERQRDGQDQQQLGRRARYSTRSVELAFPKPIWDEWGDCCELRGIGGYTLLRGLIHTLLVTPENPTWVGRGWMYRGHSVSMTGTKHGEPWPYRQRARVTNGAAEALKMRADASNCRSVALVRGSVIDFLEGRVKRVQLLTTESMFGDARRYILRPTREGLR